MGDSATGLRNKLLVCCCHGTLRTASLAALPGAI